MKRWRRRIRGAVGMGLIWAAGGAGFGGLLELIDNVFPGVLPFVSKVDMWPQTLAIPGFLGGMLFAMVLGIVGVRRRFDELSLPKFATCGAVGGLLLGGLAVAIGAPAAFIGIATLGSAIAASSSLLLARMAEKRERLDAGADAAEVGRAAGETKELRGGRD